MNVARGICKKPLALLVALILCLAPCLAWAAAGPSEATEPVATKPGELLYERLFQALGAGRRLDATLRYGLESIDPAMGAPAEEVEAVRQLLDVVEFHMGFGVAGDNVEIDLALALAGQKLISGKAYVTDEGFALETNLLPGKVVLISFDKIAELMEESGAALDIDEAALEVVLQAVEAYGAVLMDWAEGITENNMEINIGPVPATATRDASAMHVKARASDADFNALIAALATKFVADVELQRALASLTGASERDIAWMGYELLRQTNGAADQGHMFTVDVFASETGELVGVDYLQFVPMGNDALAIAVNYGRKSQEAVATDTVRMDIGARKGGGVTMDMQITTDESAPGVLTQDTVTQVRIEEATPYYGPSAMVMDQTTHSRTEISGATETTKQESVSTMRQEGGGGSQDPMLNTPMHLTLEATTEALAGDDFRTATHARYDMSMMVMTIDWTLASSEFVPTTVEGKTVIDPFTMTEEESAALEEEMSLQLMQALFAAMGHLPAPVIQMLMEGNLF